MVFPLIPSFSIILCLYIKSSALFKTICISSSIFLFVSQPNEILILKVFTCLYEYCSFIFLIIPSTSSGLVFGRRSTNSSPPQRATISSFLHAFWMADAALSNSSSPLWWPKASFISFSPLTSPIIIEMGRFLSLSNLLYFFFIEPSIIKSC